MNYQDAYFTRKLNQYEIIPEVVDIIINRVYPKKIILFGSCARRRITINSDIDICIVVEEDINIKKRIELRSILLLEILDITDFEVDIFICTEKDWNIKKKNQSTFMGKIYKEGKILYGR